MGYSRVAIFEDLFVALASTCPQVEIYFSHNCIHGSQIEQELPRFCNLRYLPDAVGFPTCIARSQQIIDSKKSSNITLCVKTLN